MMFSFDDFIEDHPMGTIGGFGMGIGAGLAFLAGSTSSPSNRSLEAPSLNASSPSHSSRPHQSPHQTSTSQQQTANPRFQPPLPQQRQQSLPPQHQQNSPRQQSLQQQHQQHQQQQHHQQSQQQLLLHHQQKVQPQQPMVTPLSITTDFEGVLPTPPLSSTRSPMRAIPGSAMSQTEYPAFPPPSSWPSDCLNLSTAGSATVVAAPPSYPSPNRSHHIYALHHHPSLSLHTQQHQYQQLQLNHNQTQGLHPQTQQLHYTQHQSNLSYYAHLQNHHSSFSANQSQNSMHLTAQWLGKSYQPPSPPELVASMNAKQPQPPHPCAAPDDNCSLFFPQDTVDNITVQIVADDSDDDEDVGEEDAVDEDSGGTGHAEYMNVYGVPIPVHHARYPLPSRYAVTGPYRNNSSSPPYYSKPYASDRHQPISPISHHGHRHSSSPSHPVTPPEDVVEYSEVEDDRNDADFCLTKQQHAKPKKRRLTGGKVPSARRSSFSSQRFNPYKDQGALHPAEHILPDAAEYSDITYLTPHGLVRGISPGVAAGFKERKIVKKKPAVRRTPTKGENCNSLLVPKTQGLYEKTYSSVSVLEMVANGTSIMRRTTDSWINATHLLKVAGFQEKAKRTKVLEKEIHTGDHEKIQGGYGKYQGTWVPLERAKVLADKFGCYDVLAEILDHEGPN